MEQRCRYQPTVRQLLSRPSFVQHIAISLLCLPHRYASCGLGPHSRQHTASLASSMVFALLRLPWPSAMQAAQVIAGKSMTACMSSCARTRYCCMVQQNSEMTHGGVATEEVWLCSTKKSKHLNSQAANSQGKKPIYSAKTLLAARPPS